MGCDIHIHLERRVVLPERNIDCWQTVNQFTGIPLDGIRLETAIPIPREALKPRGVGWWGIEDRNYEFFAALAGVRGEGPEPRGIPDDLAPLTQAFFDSWEGDAHSHSWHYADEFMELFFRHCLSDERIAEETEHRLNGPHGPMFWAYLMDRYIHCMPTEPGSPQSWRFVYFFDN